MLPSSIMFGFRIHGIITGKIFKVFIFLPNEPCMSLPSAVESGWILGKHTRQLHESHSRNTKTSKGRVPCYITVLPRMVPSKAIFFCWVDGKDLGPVDFYSKSSRPLDPPDPIESASRMHFAGKPLEKVCRFFVRSSSLKSFPT